MKIRLPEHHKDLVQSVNNRKQEYQRTNNKLRQRIDSENHHLFPRDTEGNLEMSQEPWQFGSCAETNAWFHLAS